MMLGLVRNDDLVYACKKLYMIAKSDIIPLFLLEPMQSIFGEFNIEDEYVPDYYT